MLLGCWLLSEALHLQAGQLGGLLLLMAVLQGFTESVGEKTRDLLARASERTHLLLRFLRDLLYLSRLRAEAEVQRERVPLVQLIAAEAELYAGPLRSKGLEFRLENQAGDPVVYGSRTALAQLFNNLR